jgi:hypothetical protein
MKENLFSKGGNKMSSKQTYVVDEKKTPRLIDKFFVIGEDGNSRQVQTLYLCDNEGVPQPIYKSSATLKNLTGYNSKFHAVDAGETSHGGSTYTLKTWTAKKGHSYFMRAGAAFYRPEFDHCQCRMYFTVPGKSKEITNGPKIRIDSDLSQTYPSGAMQNVLLEANANGTGSMKFSTQGRCSAGASSGGTCRLYMIVDVTELIESDPTLNTADKVWAFIKSTFYGEKEFEL